MSTPMTLLATLQVVESSLGTNALSSTEHNNMIYIIIII